MATRNQARRPAARPETPKRGPRPVPAWPGASVAVAPGTTGTLTIKAFKAGWIRWLRLLAFGTDADLQPGPQVVVTSIRLATTALFDSDTGASIMFWQKDGPENFTGFADQQALHMSETDVLTVTVQNNSNDETFIVSGLVGLYREA